LLLWKKTVFKKDCFTTFVMTESRINAVISTSVRGELKISGSKSLQTGRFLLRRNDKKSVVGSKAKQSGVLII
jgi:hypothetical protein